MQIAGQLSFQRSLLALVVAAALIQILAYWPGIIRQDAVTQYHQVLSQSYDDWHPPVMAWLWRQLMAFAPGPAPMFVLQVLLYWGGLLLLSAAVLRQGCRGLSLALLACGVMPITFGLMGAVLKDSLLAAVLLAASGLVAWTHLTGNNWLRCLAVLFLVFAATLRFNAFLAVVPLLLPLSPEPWRRTKLRMGFTALLAALALLAVGPAANGLLGAKKTGVERSLIIFDLGGITEFSGVSAFPGLFEGNAVATNQRCYSSNLWSTYSTWVEPRCPINFESFGAAVTASGHADYELWLSAIRAQPLSYLAHRLAHFNEHTRLFTLRKVGAPDYYQSVPNPWGFYAPDSALRKFISGAVRLTSYTPLGWPALWLALSGGLFFLARLLPSRAFVLPLSASALLYGSGYFVFSVASDLRYQLWTMIATLLALVAVAWDIQFGKPVPRRWLILALAPALLVTVLGVGWRFIALFVLGL